MSRFIDVAKLLVATVFAGLSASSCQHEQQPVPTADDQQINTQLVDTLRGTILDASTRQIELGVIYSLELDDEAERHSTLEEGSEIQVIVRHETDGSLTVLKTEDL